MGGSTNSLGMGPITTEGFFTSGGQLTLNLSADSNLYLPTSGGLISQVGPMSYSPTIGDSAGNLFTGVTSTAVYFTLSNGMTYVSVDISWATLGSAVNGNVVRISLPTTVNKKCGLSLYWFQGVFLNIPTYNWIGMGADDGWDYVVMSATDGGSTMTDVKVQDLAISGGEIIFSGLYY